MVNSLENLNFNYEPKLKTQRVNKLTIIVCRTQNFRNVQKFNLRFRFKIR